MLFGDEAGFCLHPKLGRVWAKKGEQPVIMTRSQISVRMNVFGWVDPFKGRHGMSIIERGNRRNFMDSLKMLLCKFVGKITLFIDNARWHGGDEIEMFLQETKRLEIEYLPKYHPELNKQEHVWKLMRYEETTNTLYDSYDDLVRSVLKKSQSWKPRRILKLCQLN
ncbi:MAG: hypothetical protein DDT31_01825 [Syntrophomonadaceae bacterium]|nr:hypothetical protein [Bacillota bacterium]